MSEKMPDRFMQYGTIMLHVIIIGAAYSSPWWLDWRLVAAGIVLYCVQLMLFGWCLLSLKQFHGEKKTFHEWYLAKLGLHPKPRQLQFVLNYVIPSLLLVVAIALQTFLAVHPFVRL